MPESSVRSAVLLPDGTTVDIEPMRASDVDRLDQFHHTLSGETIRLRFFGVHPDLSDQELHRFTHVDHVTARRSSPSTTGRSSASRGSTV